MTGTDLKPEILQVAQKGILKSRPKLEVINDLTATSDMRIMRANEYYDGALILVGAAFVGLHFFMHREGKFMLILGSVMVVVGLLSKFGKK